MGSLSPILLVDQINVGRALVLLPRPPYLVAQAVDTRIASHRDLNVAHGFTVARFPLH
jgi:hypothetical protein